MDEVVNNSLVISDDVETIQMYHDAYLDALPQTIAPVCMLLEKLDDAPTPTPTGTGSVTPTPTSTPDDEGEEEEDDNDSGSQNRGSGNQNRRNNRNNDNNKDDDGDVKGTTTQAPSVTASLTPTASGSVKGLAQTGINTVIPAMMGMINLSLLGASVTVLRKKVAKE